MINPVRTWQQDIARWSAIVAGVAIFIGVALYALRAEPAKKLSPEDVSRIGYFDVATGKPKIYFKRQKNGKFDLFDRPGFHPNTQEPLEPVSPENIRAIEDFVTSEMEKGERLIKAEKKRQARIIAEQQATQEKQAKIAAEQQAAQAAASGPAMIRIPGKNYEIGKYEVTQGEWRAVMDSNPSRFNNCGDTCPVETVSWNDVQEFIRKLNARTGKQYRLPTDAEWEYACYGGSQSEYCGGNDINAVAWYDGNSGDKTHPAGQKQANGFSLYDMSGNVWEWTNDCWEGDCAKRVLRGGSWYGYPQVVRTAHRYRDDTANRDVNYGFRVARTLP